MKSDRLTIIIEKGNKRMIARTPITTQVASGGGRYSTSGTNSAIESAGTKQQHAVGGGGTALNKWISKRRKKSR